MAAYQSAAIRRENLGFVMSEKISAEMKCVMCGWRNVCVIPASISIRRQYHRKRSNGGENNLAKKS
jgi:hypothetical protein